MTDFGELCERAIAALDAIEAKGPPGEKEARAGLDLTRALIGVEGALHLARKCLEELEALAQ